MGLLKKDNSVSKKASTLKILTIAKNTTGIYYSQSHLENIENLEQFSSLDVSTRELFT